MELDKLMIKSRLVTFDFVMEDRVLHPHPFM